MNLFKKYLLFSSFILLHTAIQSSSLFKTLEKDAQTGEQKMVYRVFNIYDSLKDFTDDVTKRSDISQKELFITTNPNDTAAKLAVFEQKPNGKYEVNYFIIEHPNISAEFSTEQEAQDFLYNFMTQPISAAMPQRPLFIPVRKSHGQDWRRVPSRR